MNTIAERGIRNMSLHVAAAEIAAAQLGGQTNSVDTYPTAGGFGLWVSTEAADGWLAGKSGDPRVFRTNVAIQHTLDRIQVHVRNRVKRRLSEIDRGREQLDALCKKLKAH